MSHNRKTMPILYKFNVRIQLRSNNVLDVPRRWHRRSKNNGSMGSSSNNNLFKIMKKEAKLINFVVIGLLLLGVISGFLSLVPTEKDKDLYFMYDLMKDYTLPAWRIPLSLFFSISAAFYAYIGLANLCQFIYASVHIKYQMEIAVNYIQKIHDLCETRDCNCEQHQEHVKDILKFGILSQTRLTE